VREPKLLTPAEQIELNFRRDETSRMIRSERTIKFLQWVYDKIKLSPEQIKRKARKRRDKKLKKQFKDALQSIKYQEVLWVKSRVTALRLEDMGFKIGVATNLANQLGYAVIHPSVDMKKWIKTRDARNAAAKRKLAEAEKESEKQYES